MKVFFFIVIHNYVTLTLLLQIVPKLKLVTHNFLYRLGWFYVGFSDNGDPYFYVTNNC